MFKVVNADPDVLSIKKLLLAGQTNEANRAKLKEAIDFAWLVGATTLAKIQAESKVNAAVQRNKGVRYGNCITIKSSSNKRETSG